MKRYWVYLLYVLRHKYFVYLEGRALHLPRLRLLLHDWDKFLPFEFTAYARYFYEPDGTPCAQHSDKDRYRMLIAWFRHQRRNRHHWQWYLQVNGVSIHSTNLLVMDSGEVYGVPTNWALYRLGKPEKLLSFHPKPMAEIDMQEMLADWRGVSRALGTKLEEWYFDSNRQSVLKRLLHPSTMAWLDSQIDPEWSNFAQIVEKNRYG